MKKSLTIFTLFLFTTLSMKVSHAEGTSLLKEMNVPADYGKTIIINTFNGHVKITGGEAKELSLKVYGNSDDKERFDLLSESNESQIKVECKKKYESSSVESDDTPAFDIEITVPDREDVNVKTGKGNLIIRNIKGKVKLYTVEGAIEAKDISENVYGVSGKGDISVANCQSDVNLITTTGNISVMDFAGQVMAFTDKGDVTLRGANSPVCASTGQGQIVLDYKGKNYGIIVNDEAGNIILNLPDKFEADLNLMSDKGRIVGDLENKPEKNYVIAPLNGGGKKLYCVASNGDIEFNLKNN